MSEMMHSLHMLYVHKRIATLKRLQLKHRKYAWDWLAILLLMVVLVITEEMKPFERSIYNATDQV